jgi:hypothetical protein
MIESALVAFCGRTMPMRRGLAIALLATLAADLGLAVFHCYPVVGIATPFTYAGLAVQVPLGFALRHRRGGALLATATQ